MRFKPIPPPPEDLAGVEAARRAVPLVPGTEADCCARLATRLECDRDVARTWLTFLRAVGLAEETASGFVRTDQPLERETLAEGLVDGVFGAREVHQVLVTAGEPLTPDAVFEAVADVVPAWERGKRGDWEREWHERVARLLGWLALAGLAERVEGGYRAVDGE